jgi:hypothetical protein
MISVDIMKAKVDIFLFVPISKEVSGMLCYIERVDYSLAPLIKNIQH